MVAVTSHGAQQSGGQPVQSGIFIGLGSNLGDREATLTAALNELGDSAGIRVVRRSSFHETEPVGGPAEQPRYLNAAAELETSTSPRNLLDLMLRIERHHGRERGAPNGPRTLDLDLLLYGDRVINDPDLVVPHPRMWERDFVLDPLAEICDVDDLRRRLAGGAHVR